MFSFCCCPFQALVPRVEHRHSSAAFANHNDNLQQFVCTAHGYCNRIFTGREQTVPIAVPPRTVGLVKQAGAQTVGLVTISYTTLHPHAR